MTPTQILLAIAFAALSVAAYPRLHPCGNFQTWNAGVRCNNGGSCMSATTFGDGSGGQCVVNVPASYNPCFTYEITVTSSSGSGHKVASSLGLLSAAAGTGSGSGSDTCRHTNDNARLTQSKFLWRAPNGNGAVSTSFSALCGDQSQVFAAIQAAALRNLTATELFTDGCPTTCAGPGCAAGSAGTTVYVSLAVALVAMVTSALTVLA